MLLLLVACSRGSRLEGVITDIEGTGGHLSGITVETAAGPEHIAIDDKIDYGFDLSHLEVHKAEKLPVSVEYEERNGEKVALGIFDA